MQAELVLILSEPDVWLDSPERPKFEQNRIFSHLGKPILGVWVTNVVYFNQHKCSLQYKNSTQAGKKFYIYTKGYEVRSVL